MGHQCCLGTQPPPGARSSQGGWRARGQGNRAVPDPVAKQPGRVSAGSHAFEKLQPPWLGRGSCPKLQLRDTPVEPELGPTLGNITTWLTDRWFPAGFHMALKTRFLESREGCASSWEPRKTCSPLRSCKELRGAHGWADLRIEPSPKNSCKGHSHSHPTSSEGYTVHPVA